MRVQLAWERSGKALAGELDLEIQDLSHLRLPLVAEFAAHGTQDAISKGRVWRGNREGGIWTRIDGKIDNWRTESMPRRPFPATLDEQVAELAAMVANGTRADGIATHTVGEHRIGFGGLALSGERQIAASGGAEALAAANWSLSRYAIIDGSLWCRHPGPLFKVRVRDGNDELGLVSFLKEYWAHTPTFRAVDLDRLASLRPDIDMSVRERLVLHDPEALRAYDVDGLNMEAAFIVLRDFVGSGRVQAMSPLAMRTYATLLRTYSENPVTAPRFPGNSGWPYDRRAFDFPFRAELVPLLRGTLDNCFERGLHDSYRKGLEAMIQGLESRLAFEFAGTLSDEDQEALTDLQP